MLTRAVVHAKLTNQRALLMRCLRSRPDDEEASRGSDEPAARDLAELLTRLERATAIDTLLGLEGQGAAHISASSTASSRPSRPDAASTFGVATAGRRAIR